MKHKGKLAYYDLSNGSFKAKLIAWLVFILTGSRINHVHLELTSSGISYFAVLYKGVRVLHRDSIYKAYGKPVFTQTVIIEDSAIPVELKTRWKTETISSCVFWHLIGRYINIPIPHTCGKITADILRDSGYPIPHNIIEPHKILKEVTNANALFIRQGKSWKNNSSQTTS
jgi:hypothetical protein